MNELNGGDWLGIKSVWGAAEPRCGQGRHCHCVHAHDSRDNDCHARLRPPRCVTFSLFVFSHSRQRGRKVESFFFCFCSEIGAIHSVVFGGFAPKELAKRIEDCQPKVVMSASCGVEPKGVIPYKVSDATCPLSYPLFVSHDRNEQPLLDEAIWLSASKPKSCVIFQRPQYTASMVSGRDHDWVAELARATPQPCVSGPPTIKTKQNKGKVTLP